MDDDIQLPPLPKPDAQYITHSDFALREYGRKCYEDGLAAARTEQAKRAKPEAHSATLSLTTRGNVVTNLDINSIYACATVTLRWTDDGRAWIDSERNRALARRLRIYPSANYNTATAMSKAADALDGGER